MTRLPLVAVGAAAVAACAPRFASDARSLPPLVVVEFAFAVASAFVLRHASVAEPR